VVHARAQLEVEASKARDTNGPRRIRVGVGRDVVGAVRARTMQSLFDLSTRPKRFMWRRVAGSLKRAESAYMPGA
jgi:hypothetical protein